MATVQLWSDDAMRDAIDRHQFILVSPTDSTRVTVLDLPDLWANDSTLVFQTGYRIGGRPGAVIAALEAGEVDPNDIQEIMASSLTSVNYRADLASIYEQELTTYQNWRRGAINSNWNAPGVKLSGLIGALHPERSELKTKSGAGRGKPKEISVQSFGTGGGSGRGGRRTVSLQEKIDALAPGKFLDVSSLKPDGTGARTIGVPPPRSAKIGTPSLPIVSSDFEHYVLAIRMLPGGETQYQTEILYMKDRFKYDQPIPGIQPVIGTTAETSRSLPPALTSVPISSSKRADLEPLQLYSTEEVLAVEAKVGSTAAGRKKIRDQKLYEEFLERQMTTGQVSTRLQSSPKSSASTPTSPLRSPTSPLRSPTRPSSSVASESSIRIPSLPPPRASATVPGIPTLSGPVLPRAPSTGLPLIPSLPQL